jgi:energy-coupling factor transport system ATP-binding protein
VTIPDPVITIRDLSFRYPKTLSGRQVTALNHISLMVRPGECVLVTGESGSGKSTLARCLNGLIPHATKGSIEGDVIVSGMNTKEYDTPDFARYVGMVFQDPAYQLVTGDVESEIAFGLEIQNIPDQEIRTRIAETAELLCISHLLCRSTSGLSWGERQRVAIASVVALRPSILVLDEPFSGIDAAAAQNLAGILEELRVKRGTTIIIFEHRTANLLPVASRQIVMAGGTIVSDMRPDPPVIPGRGSGGDREISEAAPSCTPRRETLHESPAIISAEAAHVPSLSLRDISYRYPGARVPALDGITLDFYPGEIAVISGPNGSGKTTLLKHCNGLIRPDWGKVVLGTESLEKKTVAATAHTIGLLNQHADYQIFESTISEELAFGPRNIKKSPEEIEKIVFGIRHRCALDHIDPSTPPLSLSGGEKQRVALGSILAMDTPVVILDEPTFGLDHTLKNRLSGVLRILSDTGKMVVIATHDEEFGAACGDRFIRIAGGRIISDIRTPRGPDQEDKRAAKPGGGESTGES